MALKQLTKGKTNELKLMSKILADKAAKAKSTINLFERNEYYKLYKVDVNERGTKANSKHVNPSA